MKPYNVKITWLCSGTVRVDADCLEEAIQEVDKNLPYLPAGEPDFESIEIDFEETLRMNPGETITDEPEIS